MGVTVLLLVVVGGVGILSFLTTLGEEGLG